MSTPKPHIRPKADPYPKRSEQPPDRSARPQLHPGDPFIERDRSMERNAPERVIFREDDCLR